jgi:ribosomal-protein-alanine N-acetyltransferase
MIKTFGDAISEIFDDPELKEKAKEFGKSAAKSAETFGNRFKDEDVKAKFRDVGKAAQDFGKSVTEHFKDDKSK